MKCKWCPKDCNDEMQADCPRKKQLDSYEEFFKEEFGNMIEAIIKAKEYKQQGGKLP